MSSPRHSSPLATPADSTTAGTSAAPRDRPHGKGPSTAGEEDEGEYGGAEEYWGDEDSHMPEVDPYPQPSTGDWDQYVGEQQGALQEDSAGDWAAWAADQLGLSQLVDAPQPTQLDSQVKTYLFQ